MEKQIKVKPHTRKGKLVRGYTYEDDISPPNLEKSNNAAWILGGTAATIGAGGIGLAALLNRNAKNAAKLGIKNVTNPVKSVPTNKVPELLPKQSSSFTTLNKLSSPAKAKTYQDDMLATLRTQSVYPPRSKNLNDATGIKPINPSASPADDFKDVQDKLTWTTKKKKKKAAKTRPVSIRSELVRGKENRKNIANKVAASLSSMSKDFSINYLIIDF